MAFEHAADAYELLCDPARIGRELPFLRDWCGSGRALDLACGLGDHLGALLEAGAISGGTGLDLSPEMAARARARNPDPRLDFIAGDLAQADASGHDRVLCLGNALNCLPTEAAAFAALTQVIRTMPAGGRLLLQLTNPDRGGPDHSCVVRRAEGLVVVKTVAQGRGCSLLSLTVHRLAEGRWSSRTDHQVLLRLQARPLAEAAHAAGVASMRILGGLDDSAYDAATSPDIVLRLER